MERDKVLEESLRGIEGGTDEPEKPLREEQGRFHGPAPQAPRLPPSPPSSELQLQERPAGRPGEGL